VFSVGHPLGLPLTFTRFFGFFDFGSGSVGTHDCPTFTGGSGSPILNEAGQVVAIMTATDYSDKGLTTVEVEKALSRGVKFRNGGLLLDDNGFVKKFVK